MGWKALLLLLMLLLLLFIIILSGVNLSAGW